MKDQKPSEMRFLNQVGAQRFGRLFATNTLQNHWRMRSPHMLANGRWANSGKRNQQLM